MNILQEIADKRRINIEERKKKISPETLRAQAYSLAEKERAEKGEFFFPFEKSILGEGIHFICEVKKASPSKGIIAGDFPYLTIAKEYEQAGACAISVLTEPEYFLGKDEYLQEIADRVSLPVLRKDFTIDTYQIDEAKCLGACAVLLICSLLEKERLKEFILHAHSLGLSALVEAHDERQVEQALMAGARVVGVNNRDLRTFQVDIHNSIRLRRLVPEDILFVSESGIRTAADVQTLKEQGVNAVLIGETLMRSRDKRKQLEELRGWPN
ncbi:MAG: indole-3-glycerol phosphate synthase TrpC [Lachnospiraceae bacterium]